MQHSQPGYDTNSIISNESILESHCPICGNHIMSKTDAIDVYCSECKSIVIQSPLVTIRPEGE